MPMPVRKSSFVACATLIVAAILHWPQPGRAQTQNPPTTPSATSGVPPGYYAAAIRQTGPQLRRALGTVVTREHRVLSNTDLWSVVTVADGHGTGRVLTVYRNAWRPAGIHLEPTHTPSPGAPVPTAAAWEREHAWPESRIPVAPTVAPGTPTRAAPCDPANPDAHHRFAEDPGTNGLRGNRVFADCPGCATVVAENSGGQVNRVGDAIVKGVTLKVWQVWPERRGDIARALFYMDVRYEGDSGTEDCVEPSLILTNDPTLVAQPASTLVVPTPGHMGMLCNLVLWHLQDPVDDRERRRNDIVFDSQRNRNPFVDHPDWVLSIWPECRPRIALPWVVP